MRYSTWNVQGMLIVKTTCFRGGERLLVIEHLGDVIDMLTGWKLSHNLSLFVGVAVNLVAPTLYTRIKDQWWRFKDLYFQDCALISKDFSS